VAEQQAASEAPHRISHSHHTPAAILQQQQQGHRTALRLQQQQQSGHLSALWQLLQQLTEAEFAEALREELSPATQALLSGRYISQLMAMAALGQDPVQLGQPLHLDAARAELTQLAMHTHIQAQQQQQQQQPQRRGQEQQQLQQVRVRESGYTLVYRAFGVGCVTIAGGVLDVLECCRISEIWLSLYSTA
jgi:hypothetical protein